MRWWGVWRLTINSEHLSSPSTPCAIFEKPFRCHLRRLIGDCQSSPACLSSHQLPCSDVPYLIHINSAWSASVCWPRLIIDPRKCQRCSNRQFYFYCLCDTNGFTAGAKLLNRFSSLMQLVVHSVCHLNKLTLLVVQYWGWGVLGVIVGLNDTHTHTHTHGC